MLRLRLRVSGMVSLAVVVVALAAGTASADTTIGLLDVSKQVAKIQRQVSDLVALGQTTTTGTLSLTAVCGDRPTARVFSRWADYALYALAPSGGLETGLGWSLNSRSGLVADNEPFYGGTSALFLGDGGEAASPSVCVSALHPTIRFFAKNTGNPASTLKITVLYEGMDGKVKELAVARVTAPGRWLPTPIIPFYVNLIAAASPAGVTAVAFKFKTEGTGGAWTIDDLFVDPVKIL